MDYLYQFSLAPVASAMAVVAALVVVLFLLGWED